MRASLPLAAHQPKSAGVPSASAALARSSRVAAARPRLDTCTQPGGRPAGWGLRHVARRHCAAARSAAIDSQEQESSPLVMGTLSEVDDADSQAFAVAMAQVADDTKAQDVVVLHVGPLVSWCSYMVLSSVISKPQLMAVMARSEQEAGASWGRTKQNSAGSSPWEILDFGDVVVHVMTPEQRDLYDLESFYAAAEEVELPFLQGRERGEGAGPEGQWRTRM